MELINITQCPIIEYSKLDEIAEGVRQELAKVDLKNLVISEDNLQFAKSLRAKYNKGFAEYEEGRKLIKKAVNDPYDQFEKDYKAKLASQYIEADTVLKTTINEIENGLKEVKKNEVKAYFMELISKNNIEFVTFEQVGLNITLSASEKSLQEQIKSFVDHVVSDLSLISTQEHQERIIVRYRQSLNVSQSITSVVNEVKQEEALKAKKEEPKPEEPKPIEVVIPVEDGLPPFIAPDNLIKIDMSIYATPKNFENLYRFMKDFGISYEIKGSR